MDKGLREIINKGMTKEVEKEYVQNIVRKARDELRRATINLYHRRVGNYKDLQEGLQMLDGSIEIETFEELDLFLDKMLATNQGDNND